MKKIFSFLKKYSFFLGIIIFLIILSKVDITNAIGNIKNINPFYLIMAGLTAFPILFFKSLCWNYIKKIQGINYSLKDSFLMTASGNFIGLTTPGRLGEISMAIYLKKDGYSMGKSMIGITLNRISDFVFLLMFVVLGSLFFLNSIQKQVQILILGIMFFIIMLLICWKVGLIKWGFNKVIKILLPQKYQKSWNINIQDFINDLKIFKFKNYLIILLITAISWSFYYLQMYFLSKGVNINISILYLAISVTIVGFITLIPISISGIGTRDIALILLLGPLLISKEQIIIFSALILLMSLFAALIGFICWIVKPIKF